MLLGDVLHHKRRRAGRSCCPRTSPRLRFCPLPGLPQVASTTSAEVAVLEDSGRFPSRTSPPPLSSRSWHTGSTSTAPSTAEDAGSGAGTGAVLPRRPCRLSRSGRRSKTFPSPSPSTSSAATCALVTRCFPFRSRPKHDARSWPAFSPSQRAARPWIRRRVRELPIE